MLNYLQKWKEQNISLSYEFHLQALYTVNVFAKIKIYRYVT